MEIFYSSLGKLAWNVVSEHPELMDINFGVNLNGNNADWIHFNSIDYNSDLDQIILSSRHLSEIYVIDHSTTSLEAAGHTGGNSGKGGDILFRYGMPNGFQLATLMREKSWCLIMAKDDLLATILL